MASHVERPMIFPLSNPTRLHEAHPKDINEWTKGKALIATGSPFAPVSWDGKEYDIAECNNSTCFPGIGLGCVLSKAKLLSDKMLVAAVKALAAQSPVLKDETKGLLPDVENVREISVSIAKAVIRQAVEEGLAQTEDIPKEDGELEQWVREQMWEARYRSLKKVPRDIASRHAKGELGIAGTSARSVGDSETVILKT
jgi:malate dehydrogenase (oxaloacetate-decarboxylating)